MIQTRAFNVEANLAESINNFLDEGHNDELKSMSYLRVKEVISLVNEGAIFVLTYDDGR
jgi:hypothetical protein